MADDKPKPPPPPADPPPPPPLANPNQMTHCDATKSLKDDKRGGR